MKNFIAKHHVFVAFLALLTMTVLAGLFMYSETVSTALDIDGWNAYAPEQKACTQEAKVCPDGSAVGRTGPKCEFARCPSTTDLNDARVRAENISGDLTLIGEPGLVIIDWLPAEGATTYVIFRSSSNKGPWTEISRRSSERANAIDYQPSEVNPCYRVDSLDQSGKVIRSYEAACLSPKGRDIDTSSWKTYRNEKYAFEVKYPQEWCTNDVEGVSGFVNFKSFCPYNDTESIMKLDFTCVFATGFEGEVSPLKKTTEEIIYGSLSFIDEKTFSGDDGRLLLRMLSFDLPERFGRCRKGAFIIEQDVSEGVLKNILSTFKFIQ